jgi:hypothetical protein
MVDPAILGEYSEMQLSRFADIISQCIQVIISLYFLKLIQNNACSAFIAHLSDFKFFRFPFKVVYLGQSYHNQSDNLQEFTRTISL